MESFDDWEDAPDLGLFLVAEANPAHTRAVWYLDTFANEEAVNHGRASSTDVLRELLTETVYVPGRNDKYDLGHGSI